MTGRGWSSKGRQNLHRHRRGKDWLGRSQKGSKTLILWMLFYTVMMLRLLTTVAVVVDSTAEFGLFFPCRFRDLPKSNLVPYTDPESTPSLPRGIKIYVAGYSTFGMGCTYFEHGTVPSRKKCTVRRHTTFYQ